MRAHTHTLCTCTFTQDHIAILNAYWEFNKRSGIEKMDFARENFLGIKTLKEMGDLKRQLLQVLAPRALPCKRALARSRKRRSSQQCSRT